MNTLKKPFIFHIFFALLLIQANHVYSSGKDLATAAKDCGLYILEVTGKAVIVTVASAGAYAGFNFACRKIDEYKHPERVLEQKILILEYEEQFHLDDSDFLACSNLKKKEYRDQHKEIIAKKNRIPSNTSLAQIPINTQMMAPQKNTGLNNHSDKDILPKQQLTKNFQPA